jgi:hypothetical protein
MEWKDHWVKRDEIKPGYIISTVKPYFQAFYGVYETAFVVYDFLGRESFKILEGYTTLEDALLGHEKYKNMSVDKLMSLPGAKKSLKTKKEKRNEFKEY